MKKVLKNNVKNWEWKPFVSPLERRDLFTFFRWELFLKDYYKET